MFGVAAFEVAQPSRGPDVPEPPLVDELGDEHVLLESLDAHQVHASLAAQVASVQPAHSLATETWRVL